MDITRDLATAGAKTAPPVAVTLLAKMGALTPSDWLALVTIGYVVLQAVHLLWKWRRESRAGKPAPADPLSFVDGPP